MCILSATVHRQTLYHTAMGIRCQLHTFEIFLTPNPYTLQNILMVCQDYFLNGTVIHPRYQERNNLLQIVCQDDLGFSWRFRAKPLNYWCHLLEEIRLVSNSCGLTEFWITVDANCQSWQQRLEWQCQDDLF